MQYFGRALGSVTKSWSSINPSTLSGAVDIIVVEQANGDLSCSPFHVRFGKFQILKPSQKKVEVIVNGQPTSIPMKLSENGEAFFVFETEMEDVPEDLISSPVASAASSPMSSPETKTPLEHMANKQRHDKKFASTDAINSLEEPDFLDINNNGTFSPSHPVINSSPDLTAAGNNTNQLASPVSFTSPTFTPIKKKFDKIKIPTKIDNQTGDLLLDIEGYKYNQDKAHDSDELVQQILKEEFDDSVISKMIEKDSQGNIRIINRSTPSSPKSFDGNSLSPTLSSPSSVALQQNDTTDLGSPPLRSSVSDNTGVMVSNSSTGNYDTATMGLNSPLEASNKEATPKAEKKYIKTIRLTSDQLKCLSLNMGTNDIKFSIGNGKSFLTAKLYLWKWDTPIVISDIDGTITKSDALGHVMTMIGKDWTHAGVAKLFNDIYNNGYNIMYLTARSAGLADSTRAYLKSIDQDGYKIPDGPVILSPDRTFTALKREVILKKPEVFKMACLKDIRDLYLKNFTFDTDDISQTTPKKTSMNKNSGGVTALDEDMPTPFIAGFGNRITDGISYRSVGIPKSRIFTINPDGEVHMELLELSGYKSSYLDMNGLVDHFFPPVANHDEEEDFCNSATDYDNGRGTDLDTIQNQSTNDDNSQGDFVPGYSIFDTINGIDTVRSRSSSLGVANAHQVNVHKKTSQHSGQNDEDLNSLSKRISNTQSSAHKRNASNNRYGKKMSLYRNKEEKFTDVNFWREPLPDIDDLSDVSDEDASAASTSNGNISYQQPNSPVSPRVSSADKSYTLSSRKSSMSHNRAKSIDSGFFSSFLRKEDPAESVAGSETDSNVNDDAISSTPNPSPFMANDNSLSPVFGDGSLGSLRRSAPTTHVFSNNVGASGVSPEVGQKIYLNIGSPLSSPRLDSLNYDDDEYPYTGHENGNEPDTPTKMPKPMFLPQSSFDLALTSTEGDLKKYRTFEDDHCDNDRNNGLFNGLNNELTEDKLNQDDQADKKLQAPNGKIDFAHQNNMSDEFDEDEFDDDEFED
ncbi:hypothetical protein ACO0QE_001274 [Hanseniaspora vineae]